MKRIFSVFLLACVMAVSVQAQDVAGYKRIVRSLSSSKFLGRGYAKGGVLKAGEYIEKEFRIAGVDAVINQPFKININTFPSKMRMSVDARKLNPGSDFVMREYSPGVTGEFSLYYIDTLNYSAEKVLSDLKKPENRNAMIVCDFWFTYRHKDDFKKLESKDGCSNAGMIYVWDTPLKFYKAYGDHVAPKPVIWVSSDFPKNAKNVSLEIENKFLTNFESNNVVARVNGRRHDKCYVFCAHYDHLGNLGTTVIYPGANDNASGTAAILTLAEYYANNQPEYDIWFIAFSGEDSGLNGSNWFVEHPLVPLNQIKYLFNLDMIGDNNPVQYCEVSSQGMDGFKKMQSINSKQNLFKELHLGKLDANSDHWPFAQKGVPCIMFENESGDAFPYYHTPKDDYDHVYFDTYPKIFKLVTEFIGK